MERIGHPAHPESGLAFHFETQIDLRLFPVYRPFRRQLEGLRLLKPVEIGSERQIAEENPNCQTKLSIQSERREQRDGSVAGQGYVELSFRIRGRWASGRFRMQALSL